MSRRFATKITFGIFAFLFAIYVASPVRTPFDSRWSIHTALSLVEGQGGDLSDYLPILEKNDFYAIDLPDGRPHTVYPIGVSILVAPIVGVIALINPSFKSMLREQVPANLEKVLASLIGAVAAALFFWVVLGQFQRVSIALVTTIIFSLCTSMWSTATRALWQHGPLVLMFVITMLLLQRARKNPRLIQYVGLPLAFAYLVRPTASIPIAVLTTYIAIYYRAWFVRYVIGIGLIIVPWIAFNLEIYGAILPPYYFGLFYAGLPSFAVALAGNLISPSRGLFVYSPVLLFALSGFLLSLRDRQQRPLHLAYGIIIILMLLAISLLATVWWAGHGYGPRYMTDLLPFLVYFTAFNFAEALYGPVRRAAVLTSIGILAALSLVIHAQGALRTAPWLWNVSPDNIDRNPARNWDWKDPAFLRGKDSSTSNSS